MRSARFWLTALSAVAALLLTACATTPLPDGSRIQRLAEPSAPAPLTAEEATRLSELNAQILREQNAARVREERFETLRQVGPQPYVWPYFDGGWAWTGHGWHWRPRWGLGFGWYGVWPY
jgi:hypothetical protein